MAIDVSDGQCNASSTLHSFIISLSACVSVLCTSVRCVILVFINLAFDPLPSFQPSSAHFSSFLSFIFLLSRHMWFAQSINSNLVELQKDRFSHWNNWHRFLCVAIVELIYHFWCLSEFVLNLFSFENRLECARVMNSQSLVQLETSILCANVCFLFDACTRYACQYVTRSYLHTRSKQKWLISSVGLQLHRGTRKRAVYSSIASESILIYSMFLFLTMLFSFMFRIPISRYNVRARRGGKHALSFGTHQ